MFLYPDRSELAAFAVGFFFFSISQGADRQAHPSLDLMCGDTDSLST